MGYYRKPEMTAKIIDEDGWLDTGDLGMLTRRGELRITGRAKDTIVLLGGENVEPLPMSKSSPRASTFDRPSSWARTRSTSPPSSCRTRRR